MSATSPADVLDAAADYIDEHGWTQGQYRSPQGCVCASGAIREVLCLPDGTVDNSEALRVRMALLGHLGAVSAVSAWNDRHDQTAANVTATMRKVAADLRAETP